MVKNKKKVSKKTPIIFVQCLTLNLFINFTIQFRDYGFKLLYHDRAIIPQYDRYVK